MKTQKKKEKTICLHQWLVLAGAKHTEGRGVYDTFSALINVLFLKNYTGLYTAGVNVFLIWEIIQFLNFVL